MTNPGHVDPGYEGPLHCTVINMGHESYSLINGQPIMRVLFFELDNAAQAIPIAAPAGADSNLITTELLNRLSIDFVDVEKRATKIAYKTLAIAGVLATVLSLIIPAALTYFLGIKDDITRLHSDVASAETREQETKDIAGLNSNINTLKDQFDYNKYGETLKALEDSANQSLKDSKHIRKQR